MNLDKALKLYAITDRSWLRHKTLEEVVEEALLGGVTFLQLREKKMDNHLWKEEGIFLKKLCQKYNIPFVINDNVELAKELDVDGVHIGQSDMALFYARKLLGPNKIIGVSAQSVEEAMIAEKGGADYLGVGAVFSTDTKQDATTIPLETLRNITEKVDIPVVAIGGIDVGNVEQLKNTGIKGISVISGIFAKEDVKKAARDLRNKVEEIL